MVGSEAEFLALTPMCRYAYHNYNQHYAYFRCRKLFRPSAPDLPLAMPRVHRCPECREPMADMGLDFKAPKQRDTKQWRKAHLVYLLSPRLVDAGHDSIHTLDLPHGNRTPNAELERLLSPQLPAIEAAFAAANFVEITRNSLITQA